MFVFKFRKMKENKVLSFFLLSTDGSSISSACREQKPDPKIAIIQNSEGKCMPSGVPSSRTFWKLTPLRSSLDKHFPPNRNKKCTLQEPQHPVMFFCHIYNFCVVKFLILLNQQNAVGSSLLLDISSWNTTYCQTNLLLFWACSFGLLPV